MENNISEARRRYSDENGRFTQQDAANYFGVSLSTYKKWEQGSGLLNGSILRQIAELYGVSVDYLLMRDSKAEKPSQDYMTNYERELVDIMRTITPDGQRQLMIYARGIASTYSKNNQAESA